MVCAAVIVLLLLHLHASDTLREDHEETQTLSPSKIMPAYQPERRTKPLSRPHQPRKTISREDEDLLDLMVRIAETPAEWERIHRVLSQLGAEKPQPQTIAPQPTKNTQDLGVHGPENSTKYNYLAQITESEEAPATKQPAKNTLVESQGKDYQSDQSPVSMKADNIDTGWPDFDEAITKKVKKHAIPKEDNNVLDWFEDEWLDPVWNEFSGEQREYHFSASRTDQNYPSVSFKSDYLKEANLQRSDTRKSEFIRKPNIVEFPPERTGQNHSSNLNTSEAESSHSSRPVFLYHRVTTSPQQRKGNSAFIAVSVVKQSQLEAPATTEAPVRESLWSHARHIHRIQHQLEPHRQRPYRAKHHRHHRSHTHALTTH